MRPGRDIKERAQTMSGQYERNEPEAADTSDEHSDEATGGEAPAAEVDSVAELEATAQENWDRYVRATAELENVRKRAARDVENARKFALERFARELLQVLDSLEMGIDAGSDAGPEALLDGARATWKQLTTTLEQFGVSEIDPLGEPFNPELHEAMTMQPSADAEPGSVINVFQKGYALNGRLLRPARVVVAAEPPATEDSVTDSA